MSKWQFWLNSLATVGGNLFVLAVFVVGLMCLLLYVLHDQNANANTVSTITATFGSFSGALLLGLKGRSGDTNLLPPSPPGPPVLVLGNGPGSLPPQPPVAK